MARVSEIGRIGQAPQQWTSLTSGSRRSVSRRPAPLPEAELLLELPNDALLAPDYNLDPSPRVSRSVCPSSSDPPADSADRDAGVDLDHVGVVVAKALQGGLAAHAVVVGDHGD